MLSRSMLLKSIILVLTGLGLANAQTASLCHSDDDCPDTNVCCFLSVRFVSVVCLCEWVSNLLATFQGSIGNPVCIAQDTCINGMLPL